MLSTKDKEEILQLRQEEGLSYESIHDKTNFSINTIMNVCRGKAEEEKEVVEDIQKEKKVHFDDPIEKIRAMPGAIDKFIETEQLKEGDRSEWIERREEIREIIRVEVDDRIAGERKDAVEKRDDEWRKLITADYVKKEIAEDKDRTINDLTETIDKKNTTIGNLTNTIEEKNTTIGNLHTGLRDLQIANQNLLNKNFELAELNGELNYYIGMELDDAGRQERKMLNIEKTDFNKEKTEFNAYVKKEQQAAEELKAEQDEREEKQDKREEELDEMQEKVLEDAKTIKIQLNELNNLDSKVNNTLKEIKKENVWLDLRRKQVEKLESVHAREISVERREKIVEEKEKKFKEIKNPKMMEGNFTVPIQKVKLAEHVKMVPI